MRRSPLFLILPLALALALPACQSPEKAEKKKAAAEQKAKEKKTIPDASSDTSFQSFLGRLRIAVSKRDQQMLSSMMAPDFGWRWEQPQPGTPFQYWEETNAWPELEKLAHERFTPSGDYMVSPPAFATDNTYRGYRCGARMINGAWKLAYFVTGEDPIPL
jgi:hypothetical protein